MPKKRSRHSGGTPQLPTVNKAVRRSDAAGPSTFADDGGGEGSGRDDRDGAAGLSRNARATTLLSPSLRLLSEHAFNSRLCKHLLSDVHPTELEAAQPWLKPPHLRECHGALFGDIAKEIARIAENIATTDDPELQRGATYSLALPTSHHPSWTCHHASTRIGLLHPTGGNDIPSVVTTLT